MNQTNPRKRIITASLSIQEVYNKAKDYQLLFEKMTVDEILRFFALTYKANNYSLEKTFLCGKLSNHSSEILKQIIAVGLMLLEKDLHDKLLHSKSYLKFDMEQVYHNKFREIK